VIPAGGGTKLRIGNPPEKVELALSTLRLNRVIDYEPADLTVTVEAGIRLADLQSTLAEHGQYLPIDPPFAAQATIGGVAATNSSGSLRLRYGAARDMILGARVVLADGTEVKSGGKVVKNVAGYDLSKLYIGSFGTLGVITQVSFKLQPLPEVEQTVLLTFKKIGDACRAAIEIAGSQLLPAYLNLFVNGAPLMDAAEPAVLVGLDGCLETVAWQANQVEAMAKQNDAIGVEIYEGQARHHLQIAMRTFPEGSWAPEAVICKANLRRTDVEAFIAAALETAEVLDGRVQMMGLMGNGVVYAVFSEFPGAASSAQSVADAIARLRETTMKMAGNLIVESAPIEIKRRVDVWGPVGNSFGLIQRIKNELDATGLLNPGRFVGGI
jgi:glycolate oxidase FAD binding subunit